MSYLSLPTSNQIVPVVCFNLFNKMEKKLQNMRKKEREREGEEFRLKCLLHHPKNENT